MEQAIELIHDSVKNEFFMPAPLLAFIKISSEQFPQKKCKGFIPC
jgi:hypothetical protein